MPPDRAPAGIRFDFRNTVRVGCKTAAGEPCGTLTNKTDIMHLTPKEIDKLMLLSLGMIAERRMQKGLKLNYPEAVAYITSTALEGAREGKTVEEVMKGAASVLKKDDVMEGVADMIDLLQVEAVFTDGSRLVSIHHPIK